MPYTVYTKASLATFSGRPVESYTDYADQALLQSLLLFKIGTCLASPDDLDDTQKQLVDMAILSMADAIFLNQEHQAAVASPFNSESIGSYSYSKTARAVSVGKPTGIMWFDLGVSELGICDLEDNIPTFGGIEMFEHDGVFVRGSHGGANVRFLSPKDIIFSRGYGYDPAPGVTYTEPITPNEFP